MTQLPEDEKAVLPTQLQGRRLLEFGNKKNSSGYYRDWYRQQGIVEYQCIDWNGKDGALPLDCNQAIARTDINDDGHPYDIVTNYGFSEHVSNQESFWHNVHNLTAPEGHLVGVTPYPGYWPHHGILQPTLEFYLALADLNNYEVISAFTNTTRKRWTNCYNFVKTKESTFNFSEQLLDLIHPTENPSQQALQNSRVTG